MLILASASAARRSLLRGAGVRFEVRPAEVRELQGRGRSLAETVLENARRKAAWVSRRSPGRWVLAADTMIRFGGRIYGKPRDRKTAVERLSALAGKTHVLATGVVLRNGRRRLERIIRTRVTLRALDRAAIERIVRDPTRYAGGYAVKKKNDPLIARIHGSFSNVVGLPMEAVKRLLAICRI